MSGKKAAGLRLAVVLGTTLVCYGVAETASTLLYRRGILDPESTWVQERVPGGQLEFDPIRGYRLPPIDVRLAAVASNGVIESIGSLRGNDLGFPDPDDFAPPHPPTGRPRMAVFGDSYSGAEFLATNWPLRVEEVTRQRGEPLDLFNLSVSGGGLANWQSILERLVIPQAWQLDAVIFAVHGDDLRRPFFMLHQQIMGDGSSRLVMGHAAGAPEGSPPDTLEQALPLLHGNPRWRATTPDRFDLLQRGQWLPAVDRTGRFFLAGRLARLLASGLTREAGSEQPDSEALPPSATRSIQAIHEALALRSWPVLVVFIPSLSQLAKGTSDADRSDAARFAALLGARFIDGSRAFDGLGDEALRAQWLPYDGHWGQAGSDRFAAFIAGDLIDMGRETAAH
jgi:hypothetical protein